MNSPLRFAALAALLSLSTACSFHSTATHWNGLVDDSGKPVFVKTTTNIGINLLIILPLLGSTSIDTLLGETTAEIAKEDGDGVRVIQTSSVNYWHGWPPFTWIVTPVISDVALEYTPSDFEFQKADAEHKDFTRRQQARRSSGDYRATTTPASAPRR